MAVTRQEAMSFADAWTDPDQLCRYRDRVTCERRRLREAFTDPARAQEHVLADLLRFNSGTQYGKKHRFGRLRTLSDFRAAVPVQTYADLEPWIERSAAGERGVLTADHPQWFVSSGGSTGPRKRIPVTQRFVHTTVLPFSYATWAPLVEHFPEVLERPDAVLNLNPEPPAAEPGTGAPWAVLPAAVAAHAPLERMYLRLRLAVESDVRCVVATDPALVAALPYQLGLWWPRIVKEVRYGTLGGLPHRGPNPRRARRLEELAERFGTVRPAHVWPRIRALSCSTTGPVALHLPRLREEFGAGVSVLTAPLASAEGPVTVALDRHPTAGSLVVTAAVYEFADADADLCAGAQTLQPHELQPGRDYHVVFSHVGGLYRYTAGDVVRVLDHVDGVPRLEYAGRGERSDHAGERLREGQVLRALSRALGAGGLEARGVACRASRTQQGVLAYEFALAAATPWSPDESDGFRARLDRALREESADYCRARTGGRLATPSLALLDADAFVRDWHRRVAGGVLPSEAKDRIFRQGPDDWARLTGLQERAPSYGPDGTPAADGIRAHSQVEEAAAPPATDGNSVQSPAEGPTWPPR